jgi:hypothetical protein
MGLLLVALEAIGLAVCVDVLQNMVILVPFKPSFLPIKRHCLIGRKRLIRIVLHCILLGGGADAEGAHCNKKIVLIYNATFYFN